MTTYHQLSHVQFKNRIWRNEIEMVQQEIEFFLEIINEMPIEAESLLDASKQAFINKFYHFQQLTQRLLNEVSTLEKENALEILPDSVMDNVRSLDQEYIKEEMAYFLQDYRNAKSKFKEFVNYFDEPMID